LHKASHAFSFLLLNKLQILTSAQILQKIIILKQILDLEQVRLIFSVSPTISLKYLHYYEIGCTTFVPYATYLTTTGGPICKDQDKAQEYRLNDKSLQVYGILYIIRICYV